GRHWLHWDRNKRTPGRQQFDRTPPRRPANANGLAPTEATHADHQGHPTADCTAAHADGGGRKVSNRRAGLVSYANGGVPVCHSPSGPRSVPIRESSVPVS